MRTAIVTDSNSGMLPEDAKENGIFMLNMPVLINGKVYTDNVDITKDFFYECLTKNMDITTSQPTAGDVMDLWDSILKDYDELVYIPMSSGLSGSCQSAMLYAQNYDGKVKVVNNQRISVTQRQSVLDAKYMADHGASADEIKETLERTKFDSSIYIMVDTLKYLKKGGRVTPAGAAIAELLKVKPVLQIQGEKLDAYAKVRGIKAAKKTIIRTIRDGIEQNIGPVNPDQPNAWIGMAYTHNLDAGLEFRDQLQAEFPNYDIRMDELPLSIAVHIGPGSVAATWTKILPEGRQY